MSATGRGTKRRERDAYPTPSWCTEVLIHEIVWGTLPRIWEPAVGDGAILDIIVRNVECRYHGTDVCPKNGWMEQDFLEENPFELPLELRTRWDFIITNPPFSLSQEFIEKSLKISNCVIMLLPMGFYGSDERYEWWNANKPTGNLVLSRRPMFAKNKDGKWGTDSETYNWVIWDKTGRQKTGTHFLNPPQEMYRRSLADFKARYG